MDLKVLRKIIVFKKSILFSSRNLSKYFTHLFKNVQHLRSHMSFNNF
jgi:hypothetical protein